MQQGSDFYCHHFVRLRTPDYCEAATPTLFPNSYLIKNYLFSPSIIWNIGPHLVQVSKLAVFLPCRCCHLVSVICSFHTQGESGAPGERGEKGERGEPVRIFLQWHLQGCCAPQSLTEVFSHRVSKVSRGLLGWKDRKWVISVWGVICDYYLCLCPLSLNKRAAKEAQATWLELCNRSNRAEFRGETFEEFALFLCPLKQEKKQSRLFFGAFFYVCISVTSLHFRFNSRCFTCV